MKDRTDEKLRALEAWLQNLYKDAEKEMRGKWDKYLSRQQDRAETMLSRVREAKTAEAKEAAEKKYQEFLRNSAFKNKFKSVTELLRQALRAHLTAF